MSKVRTLDFGALPIHTVEQIGPKRFRTPEGFLVCQDVPIARTGVMLYAQGELPVTAGPDRIIRITRDAANLFHPTTLASFNGKPVTSDHPEGGNVDSTNWRKLTVGVAFNARRGEDENHDVILADLLITDALAINDVEAGLREVSAGYDAHYEDTGNGTGTQTGIIGNHIALVRRGRCGPRCAIGDHDSTDKESDEMGTATTTPPRVRKQPALSDAVKAAFRDKVGKTLDDMMDGLGGDLDGMATSSGDPVDLAASGVHIHINTATTPGNMTEANSDIDTTAKAKDEAGTTPGNEPSSTAALESRMTVFESGLTQLTALVQKLVDAGGAALAQPAPTVDSPKEDDGKKKDEEDDKSKTTDAATVDSAALETGFQAVASDAEVLVPGFKFPTFDAAAKRTTTVDAMCGARREVLKQYAATADGKAAVDAALEGAELAKLDCASTAVIFKAMASAKKAANNAAVTVDANKVPNTAVDPNASTRTAGKVTSLAELNKKLAEHYGKSPA